jgi:hypothetical protein
MLTPIRVVAHVLRRRTRRVPRQCYARGIDVDAHIAACVPMKQMFAVLRRSCRPAATAPHGITDRRRSRFTFSALLGLPQSACANAARMASASPLWLRTGSSTRSPPRLDDWPSRSPASLADRRLHPCQREPRVRPQLSAQLAHAHRIQPLRSMVLPKGPGGVVLRIP